MAQEVLIRQVRVLPVTDAKRPGEFDTVAVYQVANDPLQVHVLSVPGKDLSEERVKQAIREDMAKRSKIEGVRFSV